MGKKQTTIPKPEIDSTQSKSEQKVRRMQDIVDHINAITQKNTPVQQYREGRQGLEPNNPGPKETDSDGTEPIQFPRHLSVDLFPFHNRFPAQSQAQSPVLEGDESIGDVSGADDGDDAADPGVEPPETMGDDGVIVLSLSRARIRKLFGARIIDLPARQDAKAPAKPWAAGLKGSGRSPGNRPGSGWQAWARFPSSGMQSLNWTGNGASRSG